MNWLWNKNPQSIQYCHFYWIEIFYWIAFLHTKDSVKLVCPAFLLTYQFCMGEGVNRKNSNRLCTTCTLRDNPEKTCQKFILGIFFLKVNVGQIHSCFDLLNKNSLNPVTFISIQEISRNRFTLLCADTPLIQSMESCGEYLGNTA